MIELRNVGKSFNGKPVFSGVNFEIQNGELLCLIGGSGSGKSVLTRIILGLEEPDEGQVFFEGENMAEFNQSAWQRALSRFGVVFQNAALFDSLTVLENVGIRYFEHRILDREAIRQRVIQALQAVNLPSDILDLLPESLSGGMRKRVAIARAIIHEPDYIIYDEPTTGLDPVNADLIDELIESLAAKEDQTTIVITHDMRSVERLADRVVMLYQHQLQFVGSKQAFFASDDPVVQRFIAREKGANPG